MDKQQIDSLRDIVGRAKVLDYQRLAIEAFSVTDLETVHIEQGYNVAEAIPIIHRALDQLDAELNSENARYLPSRIAIPDVSSNHHWDIHGCLSGLISDAQISANFRQIGVYIHWLVVYEIFCGFWDKSEKKLHSVDEIKLKEQQRELELLQKKLTDVLNATKELEVVYSKNAGAIEDLIRVKKEEFTSLTNMFGKAQHETAQITQMWEQATRQKGEFDNLINQASESIKNVNAQLEAQKTDFGTLKDSIQNCETELLNTAQTANDTLKTILNSKDQIAARMKEAAELLGMSADAALGGKFNKREADVRNSLIGWRYAVVGSVVLAVAWAVTVFLCLATKTDLPYLDIIVNLVKTTPGFVLMGYVMAQYNKERAIEEEYAFKAAIAMTINAYANLLQENDSETNKTRQTMLLDAIKQVYAKPQMHREDVSAKTYKNAASELMDVLKNLKSN